MREPHPTAQVAVLILSYNRREDLAACLRSLEAGDDREGIHLRIVVADNGSADGSAAMVREQFPHVDCLALDHNHGFAQGNNLGWQHIRQTCPDTEFLVLLNQDTIVERGWLKPLVQAMREHPDAACVQAKLRLHPQTGLLNSAGNRSHYLGFGFTTACGQVDEGQHDQRRSIDFPSGAAVMIRAALLDQLGLFEEAFFLYLEDAELGWRMRQAGYAVLYEPRSIVYHKYDFDGTLKHYHLLERNRWWLILTYYRWRTLLVLSPALVAMELGQWLFALNRGLMGQKLRSYRQLLSPANLRWLKQARRRAQQRRAISDRTFMQSFTGTIDAEPMNRGLVRYVANPLLGAYWALIKRLIFW